MRGSPFLVKRLEHFELFEGLERLTKETVMPRSYDDLIEPTIVKQVSKSVAYCRCTRSKNLPFCDGSHAVTRDRKSVV